MLTPQRKLVVALLLLATLALVAWRVMDPGKLQQFTWLALGFFAFRIVLQAVRTRYDEKHLPDASPDSEQK